MSAILRSRGQSPALYSAAIPTRKAFDPEDQVLPFHLDEGTDDNEEIRQRRYSSSSSSSSDGDSNRTRGAGGYRGRGNGRGPAPARRPPHHRSRRSQDKESEWEKASNGHREDEDDASSNSDSDHQPTRQRPESVKARRGEVEKPESPRHGDRKKTQQSESESDQDSASDSELDEELRKDSASSARTVTTASPSSSPSTPRILAASDLATLSKLAVFPGSEHQLVQAYVRRVKTLLHSQYQFFINDQPVLMAEKQSKSRTPNYYLFDMTRAAAGLSSKLTKKSGNYIGKVRSNFTKKKSVLIGNQSRKTELGAVIFSGNVSNSEPRRVTVVLPPLNHKRQEIDGIAVGDEPDIFSILVEHYKAFKKQKKASHNQHHVQVFENKQPVFENGFYRLNFHGRVSVPSVKNFQLIRSESTPPTTGSKEESDAVFLQFGKVDDNKFHLDFRAPITPIQAFAIALAQFNL